jgi:hypothetical protein
LVLPNGVAMHKAGAHLANASRATQQFTAHAASGMRRSPISIPSPTSRGWTAYFALCTIEQTKR